MTRPSPPPSERKATGRVLETILWVVGAVLVLLVVAARVGGEVERRLAIASFAQASAMVAAATHQEAQPAPIESRLLKLHEPPDQSRWDEVRVQRHAASMASQVAADGLPVALLRIARVALEVPVYGDLSERNLNRGAALVQGTAAPGEDGNIAIAAHRDGYFRALAGVRAGDVIEVEGFAGPRSYRVSAVSIVAPTDLWPLDPTDVPSVTLITCYPFHFVGRAPKRFIVRAEVLE